MKRKIAASVSVVCLSAMLAACGSSGGGGAASGGDSGKSGEASAVPAPRKDPVELSIINGMSTMTEEQFMDEYGKKIMEKFPHVKIKYYIGNSSKTMTERITAGEPIDIIFASSGLTVDSLIAHGLEFDISNLIKTYQYDLNRIEPTSIEFQKKLANGGIYGLPINTNTLALFYNKDIFDKFGVPYPKEGMTWDEMYDLAKKMSRQEGGIQYRGFVMSFPHMFRLNQLSVPFVDPQTNKPTFDSDGFKKLTENFARFFAIPGNEGNASTVQGLATQRNYFYKDRTAAMIADLGGAYTNPILKDMNWDIVQVPSFKDKMGIGTQTYPTYYYITGTSKYKEQAFEIISYLTTDEFQTLQAKKGYAPIVKNPEIAKQIGQDTDVLKGKNVKSLLPDKFASPVMLSRQSAATETAMYKALEDIVQNKTDINSALRTAAEAADKAIKELEAKTK
ncbi:ABC transporter substrate-binding protein [Paenibacillus ginsengarvi]|uniref:Extracellular solute-binding protein n=1 Tax=Paenibacillus ginsengarvi TaxID=400777 RepID=A0A3B0CIC5_9BACL|nr:extracellular solute-binding protein [Paenibacillus ginsengarvi]RKN84952.1 extracellular solute-binding protein [Paenibacillus ginsengarvi]